MPTSRGFYGPLDWYDPDYTRVPTIRAKTNWEKFTSHLEDVVSPFVDQPLVRIGGVLGDLFDEGFRGRTAEDPDWKIAGVPDLPGTKLSKITKNLKADRAAKAQTKVVEDVIKESKKVDPVTQSYLNAIKANKERSRPLPEIPGASVPLDPKAGTISKSAQLRQQENPLFATVPNRLLVTEGPIKKGFLEDAAKAVSTRRGPMPYDYRVRMGLAPEINKPLQLPERGSNFFPELPDLDPISGATRGPTDLPPIDLDSFYTPRPAERGTLPSLGKAPLRPETGTDLDNWLYSIENRLRGDSPAGNLIADKYIAYRTDKGVIAGNWESKFDDIVASIPKGNWEEVRNALESGATLQNPRLEAARKALTKLDDEITSAALKNQLKMRNADGTELVDFVPHEKYWPHIYEKSFWDNPRNTIDALVKKGYSEAQGTRIVDRAQLYGGRLVDEGERLGKGYAKKFGAQLKTPQHVRQLDLPGYRTDPGAYKIHIRDMADRIAAKQQFGDLDIAGGPFKELLETTSNPAEMKKIMTRVMGREMEPPSAAARNLSNAALTLGSAAHLSNFMINNPLQLAMSAAKAPKAIPAGIKAAFQRGKRLKAAQEAGALTPVHSDAISGAEGLTNKLATAANKAFGIEASEKFTRSVSSAMGQDEAQRLFANLKKNPTNDKIRNRIEELTLTNATELLAQDSLTKLQLDRAGGTFAARTQGRAQPFDLPYHMTGGSGAPYKNVALQFGKYAIIQPKLLMDAARQKPLTTALAGGASYYGGSEAIGAIKDAKRAAVAAWSPDKDFGEAWDERREARGDFGPGRVAKTLSESWLFGKPADVIRSYGIGGGRKAAEAILPPALSI